MKNQTALLLAIIFCFLPGIHAIGATKTHAPHPEYGFSFHSDTIFVDIKGTMTHALKYHDKYYALFDEITLKYGGRGQRWLYVFSEGRVERIVQCPKKLDATYLDLFVINDSIVIKQYISEPHFYLDTQNFTWHEIEAPDDLIFEDEKFMVYSLDFGEWGGKTWFKDKKTGKEYVIAATTPLINKVDNTYYFTKPYMVLKIENPLNLGICPDDVTYENIEKTEDGYLWYGEPTGFDVIYNDDSYDYFGFGNSPRIVSSFVWNNELLHIYKTEAEAYIARIENDTIKPIQKMDGNLRFYNWHNSYRSKNGNGNNELLKFRTDDEQLIGLLEVIDNKIITTYIYNRAELKPKSQSHAQADSIFLNRLNLILTDMGDLRFSTIDRSEMEWGSFRDTPGHKIGLGESYYPNPNKYELDDYKIYLIFEDSLISSSVVYYGTKANDLIRVAFYEWYEANQFFGPNLETKAAEVLREKIVFLEDAIVRKAGKPTEHIERENFTTTTWKTTDGFTIELENSKNFNRIRMIIYKD